MTLNSTDKIVDSTDWMALMKTLSSKPRLQSIFYLFIYPQLSLTELSEHLHKTKNTTIYHMKRLVQQDLAMEFDRPVEGSIKPEKVYQINPDFYQKMFLPFDKMAELSQTELLEYSQQVSKWNTLLFETMREMLKELSDFYRLQDNQIQNSEKRSDTLKFHQEFQNPRDFIPLSDAGFHEYMRNYQVLAKKTQEFLTEESRTQESIIRPYLVFNTVLPIQQILAMRRKQNLKKK